MSAALKSAPPRKKVFLVDDHPVARRGLTELVDSQPDVKVCGEAESAESALPAIIAANPDLVIADISLPGADGIDLIRFLRKAGVKSPVLVLTMHEEEHFADRALRAGARGFIMKYRAMSDLLGAIRCVLGGQVYLSAETAERILNKEPGTGRRSGIAGLSDRERQVLELLGSGQGTRVIAEKLRLSVKTIETYRAKIKEKLNLSGAPQLMQKAVQWVEGAGSRSQRGRPSGRE